MVSRVSFAGCFLLVVCVGVARGQEDLRKQFDTSNVEAARKIAEAVDRQREGDRAAALRATEEALRADPKSYFALYTRAYLLEELGRIPEALETYEQAIGAGSAQADVRKLTVVEAMLHLGLCLSQLGKYEEGNRWFTAAIMYDPSDSLKRQHRAYWNMSVNQGKRQRRLAAFLTAATAWKRNPDAVKMETLRGLRDNSGGEDTACLLTFEGEMPTVAPREHVPLRLLPMDIGRVGKVRQMLPDPRGRYVVMLIDDNPSYCLAKTEGEFALTLIHLPWPVACGCLVEERLYLVSKDQPALHEVSPPTGRIARTYSLDGRTPDSVAVFPSLGLAFFPSLRKIYGLKLASNEMFATDIPGEAVAGHPQQKFVYSILKPAEPSMLAQPMEINGVEVWLHGDQEYNRKVTALFRSAVTADGLLLSDVAVRIAQGGSHIVVSPDGQWVCVPGRYGWHPRVDYGAKAGDGVPVFSATRLERFQAILRTEPRPLDATFNPVTGQVAVVNALRTCIYHLSDGNQRQVLEADATGPCAWSGNGVYLLLARAKSVENLYVYRNTLTAAEQQLASTWYEKLATPAKVKLTGDVPMVASLRAFQVKSKRDEAAQAIGRALRKTPNTGTGTREWKSLEAYTNNSKALDALFAAEANLQRTNSFGIGIYQLREARKQYPDCAPLAYRLAQALRKSGQDQEAEPTYVEVVRVDAGRTELTAQALEGLHELRKEAGDSYGALYCLAEALCLDRANPGLLNRVIPLLEAYRFPEEAKRFSGRAEATAGPVVGVLRSGQLPELPHPDAAKELTAKEIYARSVPAIVFLTSRGSQGTGFCVAKPGCILTNAHVVGEEESVSVHVFAYRDQKPVELPETTGRVVYRSEDKDIAVVVVAKPPESMQPLEVASFNAEAGAKVFAIGNPGLGQDVLSQTLSEGIVSHPLRNLEGNSYVQHTAAVNPGNSGGPLLDDKGCVVGMVTLRANLRSVGFAIPVKEIRDIFRPKRQQ
jgi:S1-C subfamily serine protease/Tfp pilus assembly protein PilF